MIKITEQTVFADRYTFQRLLGRGGFSEVWLATDKITGLDIAVKVYAPGYGMDNDGMKEFCQELSQVYNLNNTYLLKPQHVDNWEGMPYLVMPYCKKGSCHQLIGTMDEKLIWKLIHDVSSGLAYLHKQGIIHQDIKPDNILVDDAGNYVITDFGISVKSRSTLRKSMNIASGSGTTAYMGPERFSTDPTPIMASDIWSLGATAYELLTGNAPFGEVGGGLQKGGADLPTIKKDISAELRMALSKMLALDTWDRPTAEDLVSWSDNPKDISFQKAKDTGARPTVIQNPVSQPPKTDPKPNPKGWIIGVVIAVVLAVCGGIAAHIKNIEDEKQKTAIQIQVDLKKECDNYIYSLKFDDLNNFDASVKKLRELESFENESPFTPYLQRRILPDEMSLFKSQLIKIKTINQAKLETDYAGFDKSGPTYTNCERRIRMLTTILSDFEKSDNPSPKDIHVIIDDF